MVSPLKEKTGGTTGGMAQRGGVGRRFGLLTSPRCGGVAVARPFVDASGPFVTQTTLVPACAVAHETGMKHDAPRFWDVETAADGLRRQGCAVLRALGERRLAREFTRRARATADREALAVLLLDFLLRRRAHGRVLRGRIVRWSCVASLSPVRHKAMARSSWGFVSDSMACRLDRHG
jgi:hypothetical protein